MTSIVAGDVLYENCKSDWLPWSIITTSGPNATLATVLAGFMLAVMSILLGRAGPGSGDNVKAAHTLALFGSGVLVLGLDAYLFGNISALGPTVDPATGAARKEMRQACAMAWTEAMPAASMLVLGACLMIAGLAWILVQYFVLVDTPSKWILRVPGIITGVVLLTTSPLLVQTGFMYLVVMHRQFDKQIPMDSFKVISWILSAAAVIGLGAIVAQKTRLLRKYMEEDDATRQKPPKLNADHGLLALTFILTAVLAAIGAVFAGVIGEHGVLVRPEPGAPGLFWIYVAWALAVLPILVMIPIALAVPSAPEDWQPRAEPKSS
jgi:hypothetical protein